MKRLLHKLRIKLRCWWHGIKVTGDGMVMTDTTRDTINPEPSEYGYKWAIYNRIKMSKSKPKRRRQRDIDAEKLEKIKDARVLNDLIGDDGLRPDDTPTFDNLNLTTGKVTKE